MVSRALFLYLLPLLYSVPQIAASASLNFNLLLLNLTRLLYYACVFLTYMVISKVTSTRNLCLPPFTQEYSPVLPVMQCLKTVSYILSSFFFFVFSCIWRANLAPVFCYYSNKVTNHLCPCPSTWTVSGLFSLGMF